MKMGKVELLLDVSRTWVKAHVHRQDPTYTGPFPRTQSLKNKLAYARINLRTHEYSYVRRPEPTHVRTQT